MERERTRHVDVLDLLYNILKVADNVIDLPRVEFCILQDIRRRESP